MPNAGPGVLGFLGLVLHLAVFPTDMSEAVYTVSLWVFAAIFLFLPTNSERAKALFASAVMFLLLGIPFAEANRQGDVPWVRTAIALNYASAYALSLLIIDQVLTRIIPLAGVVLHSPDLAPLTEDRLTEERTRAVDQTVSDTTALVPTSTPEASPSFAVEAPAEGMALKLKRSQRSTRLGNNIFMLDARLALSAEYRDLVAKYKLGGNVIYESAKREAYAQAARDHLDASSKSQVTFASAEQQFAGMGKGLYRLGRAAFSATAAALSLRITVNSLTAGIHIECKNMSELLEAEEAITIAAHNLKLELELAKGFDGREELIEF